MSVNVTDALEDVPPFKIDFTDKIYSRLDSQGKAILSDYAKAYPKIKNFYCNLQMDAMEEFCRVVPTSSAPNDAPMTLLWKKQYKVRYNDVIGDTKLVKPDTSIPLYGRIDVQYLFQYVPEGHEVNRKQQQNSGAEMVVLYTPTTCYEFSRHKANQYYALNKKRKAGVEGYRALYFDKAPYSNYGGTDLEHIILPSESLARNRKYPFYIEYVKTVNKQGRELVEIRSLIDREVKDGQSNTFSIYTFFKNTFVVDSIYSCHEENGKQHWRRMTCTYSGEKDGIPLLESVEKTNGVFGNDDPEKKEIPTERTVWKVTNIVPGPVLLAEFDVAQFLPPEAKDAFADGYPISPYRIFCLIAGPILIAIAILIRIRIRIRNARRKK
ncbi:hypothetical protein FACS1894170_00080 [Planctomycetales bacterium]|nr:hypothetical protein FACS1894170_00080 [Planctomycetales bacterium]